MSTKLGALTLLCPRTDRKLENSEQTEVSLAIISLKQTTPLFPIPTVLE